MTIGSRGFVGFMLVKKVVIDGDSTDIGFFGHALAIVILCLWISKRGLPRFNPMFSPKKPKPYNILYSFTEKKCLR